MLSTVDLCTRFSKMGTPLNSANGLTLTPGGGTAESEEVRTLFVSGLPMDVRLRELYLLFRCYEGYEGSFLKLISSKPGKSPQPIAFVSFKSRIQAEKALDELQGVRFDPASSQTLRLEFAHTNSRVSPRQPMAASPGYYQAHKNGTCAYYVLPNAAVAQQTAQGLVGMTTDTWSPRMPMPYQNFSHMSASPSPTLSPVPSYPHLSMLNVLSDSDSSYYQEDQHYPCMYPMQPQMYYDMLPAHSPTPPSSASTLTQPPPNNTPCSTLFVANLDLQNTEEEIGSIFGSCRGFIKAKMFSRGGPPVAFVEFKDVECATEAMEHLQGFILLTSKRVNSGIRIEYAKQRMGEQPTRSPATLDGNSPSPIQTIQSTPAQHSPTPQSISGSPSPLVQGDVSPPRPQQLPVVSGAGFSTPISMVYSNGYSPQAQMFMNGFSSHIIPTWHFKPADQQSN